MAANLIIQNGTLIAPEETLPSADLLIENGRISRIAPKISVGGRRDCTRVDARGLLVLPGLIDIHTHGGKGSDIMDATPESFAKIAAFQASHGVTTFIPSTITAPFDETIGLLQTVSPYVGADLGGAVIAGIHLEGPFLSREHRGAHPQEHLLTPQARHLSALKEFRDIIRTVTIAPEIEGALQAIKELASWGVLVAGGHDMATEEIIDQAIENGMRHTTHIYCVMSGLRKIGSYRNVGLTEYTLLDDRLSTEMIGDNRHIPPLLAKLVFKCKGAKGVCLVSDCIRAAGLPLDGERSAGRSRPGKEPEFIIRDGISMTPDGSRFAGSITTLDTMMRNMVHDAGIGLNDAVRMATLTPAEIQGIDRRKGSLEAGKDGDICIIDPDFNVRATIVAGRVVFQAGSAAAGQPESETGKRSR